MIKINLATLKQATGVSAATQGGSQGGTSAGTLSLGITRLDTRLDSVGAGLKELPIRKLALMALVGFLAVFLLDGYKSEELGKVEADLAKVTTEQNQLRAEVAKTKGYEELKKALDVDELTIRTKIETIQKLIADRQGLPKMMVTVSKGIPADVWLSDFKVGNDEINVKGYSLGYNPISDFMKSLTESAQLADVRLVNSQQSKDELGLEVAQFELAAKRR